MKNYEYQQRFFSESRNVILFETDEWELAEKEARQRILQL